MYKNFNNNLFITNLFRKFFCVTFIFLLFSAVKIFAAPGDLDPTFNPAGVQPGNKSTTIDNININNVAQSVVIQADGKIVAAGYTDIGGGIFQFAVARFNNNGSLDTTFNPAGVQPGTKSTTIDNININNVAQSVAIQADGKIVAAGYTDIGGGISQFAVARFNNDGSLDTTFNPTGVQPGTKSTTIDNNTDNLAFSIAIQADGKIVAAGYTGTGGVRGKFAVARFNNDGSLDTTFNPAGVQPGTKSTTIDNININNVAYGVAIQADGKIVAAGYTVTGGGINQFAVARFNNDGSLDTTFNPAGVQRGTKSTTIDNINIRSEAYSVAIQENGKIVAAGYTRIGGINQFAVARFNVDGSLDTTFNSAGAQRGTKSTMINNININNKARSVAIQADGKIVAAGYTVNGGGALQFAVARFNKNGSLDSTFNSAGAQRGTKSTTIDNNINNVAYSVAIKANGKIVAAGYTDNGGGTGRFAVARFDGDVVAKK